MRIYFGPREVVQLDCKNRVYSRSPQFGKNAEDTFWTNKNPEIMDFSYKDDGRRRCGGFVRTYLCFSNNKKKVYSAPKRKLEGREQNLVVKA